jgi:hypothetical protein
MIKEDFELWFDSPNTKEFLVKLEGARKELISAHSRIPAITEKLHLLNELKGQIAIIEDILDKDQLEKLLVAHIEVK